MTIGWFQVHKNVEINWKVVEQVLKMYLILFILYFLRPGFILLLLLLLLLLNKKELI